jgi:hypothetical protein
VDAQASAAFPAEQLIGTGFVTIIRHCVTK